MVKLIVLVVNVAISISVHGFVFLLRAYVSNVILNLMYVFVYVTGYYIVNA